MPGTIDFEAIFDASPNPYMLLKPDLTFAAANEAYLRVTGRRREEIIGRHLFEAFPGDPSDEGDRSARELKASLERVLAEGEPDSLALIRYAIPRQTPEGVVFEERFWSATHTPIFDEDGEVALILQHTVDVTELQQLKKELRVARAALDDSVPTEQVEEGVFRRAQILQETNRVLDAERRQLRLLFEQAPGFIAVLRGPDHVFQLVNEAYLQVVGDRDIVDKPLRQALPEIAAQGFVELLDDVYRSGEPYIGRAVRLMIQREPDAPPEEVFVDFVYQPVFERDGSVSGIFVQGHEVTEQKRAEAELHDLNETLEQRVQDRTEALRMRNQELQEFAYAASHDLQEPLRKIGSFAGLLRAEYGEHLDDGATEYLDRMEHAATRMSALIRDLLSFSRVSTRGKPFQPVDLGDVAGEVLSALELQIDEAGAVVDVDALPVVEADPSQMHQLLQNLISNAIKFRREGVRPHVRVRSRVLDGEAGAGRPACRLDVSDNGIGFDEKHADRIFAPFQRLHGRSAYDGTGMGLAICRRIVERHDGRLTVESVPGEGSRFTVVLPLQHQLAEESG